MEDLSVIYARDLTEYHEVTRLMTRENCVKCDDTSHLECPTCDEGKSCQYQIATDCSKCDQAICVTDSASSGSDGGSSGGGGGPNTGAIAGGVVGGLAFVAILTYLAWRFLIKPRRAEAQQSSMYEVGGMNPAQESEKDGASRLTRRSSTHTVHSIASTVLTRASNIIQIAYIPGVTNRTNSSSGGSNLVPPVPPIPAQHTGGTQNSVNDDQHFFMPADLRDSTYSGLSGYTDRTSYARTSYAPRSSIASTIYGKQAQVMAPAQNGMRVKPTMVSVKGINGSPESTPPPVPSINFDRFGGNGRPESGASAFSVGSTFLNTATQARAQVVKVGGGLRKVDIGGKSDTSSSKSSVAGSSKHESPATGAITLINDTNSPYINSPTVTVSSPDQGPFSDPPDGQQTVRTGGPPSLGPVMEAELEGDSVMRKPETRERATSPFGDEHATK